jgi:hypothetical protein
VRRAEARELRAKGDSVTLKHTEEAHGQAGTRTAPAAHATCKAARSTEPRVRQLN